MIQDMPREMAQQMTLTNSPRSMIQARDLSVTFNGNAVLQRLDIDIPDNQFTAIIGGNGSGKSTLLKTLARVLRPDTGEVLLDGRPILEQPTRYVAKRLSFLSQSATAPEGVLVAELVWRGRFPHRRLLKQSTGGDGAAVDRALQLTGIEDLVECRVDELSGGQRQRAWIAMVLAQETPLLLLDEPTTFLDIAHQIELMELLSMLVRSENRTVVTVLHDLNQVGRYADHVVAIKGGRIAAEGPPQKVMTVELLQHVFDLSATIIPDPTTGTPMVIPSPRSQAWPVHRDVPV